MDRRLSGILAADAVGYSRLMERDEADTFSRLRSHRKELFEPKISEHHGRIFKLMGDGLLAEFGSVVDAVECAAVLQREMADRNRDLAPDRRIDVRMGVHVGEVIVEGDDRHGEAVNIAARLQQLAEPGGIAVSRTVLDHVGNRAVVGFEPMGSHHVKNIEKPVSVYRVKLDGVPRARRMRSPLATLRHWRWAAAAAVFLLLAAGGTMWSLKWARSGNTPRFDKPSVAVLPFDNIGGDPKWDRFAGGITEDIITDLSHSKALFVIARNSTEIYKGKAVDVREVGHDLGVTYVLEGSIEPMGEQVRITTQLIEATAGTHVWSERFDRPSSDLFAVQNEVTERIAAAMTGYQGAVAEAERLVLHRKAPESLAAFDYYLLGMEAKHSLTKEGFVKAEEDFNKALEIDPHLARAYVGIVQAYALMIDNSFTASIAETVEKMIAAAKKAVELDPDDGNSQLALGIAYAYRGDLEKAAASFERAEELSPNDADVLLIYAWLLPNFGDPPRAVELAERALRLNPHYPDWYIQALRYVYFFGQKFEKSFELTKQAKNPSALDYAFLAMDAAYLGKESEAKSASVQVLRLDPSWNAEQFISSQGGYARGEEANLLALGAEKAGLPACMADSELKNSPETLRLKICDQRRHEAALN